MNKALACLLDRRWPCSGPLPVLGQRKTPAIPRVRCRIIVAFPVGGLLDTVSRIVGDKLSQVLGQQFIIESRPGAGGTLATAAVARAEPDGYTLMMINDNHAVNPSVFKNIPYDSLKDFAPIGFVGSAPMALSANARLPVRSVQDLVELARQQPGKISYASVGVGSASHLAGELFAAKAGVRMLHVPFRGGAPAINDLVAGHVDTMFVTAVVGGQHMKTGALTPLALAAAARFETLPEVPTMAEAGYPLEAAYWFGSGGSRRDPAGHPRETGSRARRGARDARPAQAHDGDGGGGDAARLAAIRRLHPRRDDQMGGRHRAKQD